MMGRVTWDPTGDHCRLAAITAGTTYPRRGPVSIARKRISGVKVVRELGRCGVMETRHVMISWYLWNPQSHGMKSRRGSASH